MRYNHPDLQDITDLEYCVSRGYQDQGSYVLVDAAGCCLPIGLQIGSLLGADVHFQLNEPQSLH